MFFLLSGFSLNLIYECVKRVKRANVLLTGYKQIPVCSDMQIYVNSLICTTVPEMRL